MSGQQTTKVLILEDAEGDALVARAQLRAAGDFRTVHCETLAAALSVLASDPDVGMVLMDLNLPDSAGLDTFDRVRGAAADLPLVILSGQDDETLALEAVNRGAQDHIPKSLVAENPSLLPRSLRYAAERHAGQAADRRLTALERDLTLARSIQTHLLPQADPSLEGFDIAGTCRSAESCSGDFFDYIPLGDGVLDLVVADVSGHGFGPALTMVGVRRTLRTAAATGLSLPKILETSNAAVFEDTLPEQFVTCFYGRLRPDGTLEYVAAGHPAWVVRAAGGEERLDAVGLPLGMLPDTPYAELRRAKLSPGDVLLLMTDGCWEAMAPDQSLFGRDRIYEIVREDAVKPCRETVGRVVEAIDEFSGGREQSDDVTLVAVRMTGG